MSKQRPPSRIFRAKAHTWLEQDGQPGAEHVSIDPREHQELLGGHDEEGRFIVLKPVREGGPLQSMVGDRRHWTEVPPKPVE